MSRTLSVCIESDSSVIVLNDIRHLHLKKKHNHHYVIRSLIDFSVNTIHILLIAQLSVFRSM